MDMERCCRKANSYRMTTNIVNGQFFNNSRTFKTKLCLDSIYKMKTSLFLFLVTKFHVYLNCPSISIIWQYNLIIYQSSSMKWSKYWTENNGYLNSLRYSFKTPSTELISSNLLCPQATSKVSGNSKKKPGILDASSWR